MCKQALKGLLWNPAAEGAVYRAALSKPPVIRASEGYSNTEEEILFPLARY